MTLKNESRGDRLYKIFIYVVLSILAVLILVPVLWVMVASVKETSEHYGSPWALPTHIHWQNFADAWSEANMGGYMFHSVSITFCSPLNHLLISINKNGSSDTCIFKLGNNLREKFKVVASVPASI